MMPAAAQYQDRRRGKRFPLRLSVRYRRSNEASIAGFGITENMSSRGALIGGNNEMRLRDRVEVIVEWPVLLDDRIPIQLVAIGRVVRCDPHTFAVAFSSYEFRTVCRKPVPPVTASRMAA